MLEMKDLQLEELKCLPPAVISKSRLKDCYPTIKKNLPFLIKIDSKFADIHNILSFMVEHCENNLFWFK